MPTLQRQHRTGATEPDTHDGRAHWRSVVWPARVRIAQERARWRDRDPLNYRVHVALACLYLLLVSAPVSAVELAGIPLGVCFLFGLRHTYKLVLWSLVSPLAIAIIAWSVFRFVSLAWSPDVALGLDHLRSLRWVWAVPAFAPVLDRRGALVGAMSLGVALGMVAQCVNWIGPAIDLYPALWQRAENRFSGWWHPVVAGTILVASIGLHAPVAVLHSGKTRVYAIAMIAFACVAILATGSRGAWIEGAIVLGMVGVFAIVRLVRFAAVRRTWRELGVGGAVAAGVVVVSGAAAWMFFGDSIRARVALARQELVQAIDQQDYSTDTGARMAMLIMGWQCFTHHAVFGAGEGGFASWSRTQLVQSTATNTDVGRVIHNHAHNTYLHVMSTGGIVSALLGAGMIVVAVGNALSVLPGSLHGTRDRRLRPDHALAIAPACALVAILVAGLFDSVHINAQTSAWLLVLVAMCQHEPVRDVGA